MPVRAGTELRLTELIASLSLATDLGMGQPMEQALRSCLISLKLAQLMGCSTQTCADVYYLALMEHVACTADAHEAAVWATNGDDLTSRRIGATLLTSRAKDRGAIIRAWLQGQTPTRSARVMFFFLTQGKKYFEATAAARCEAAAIFADRFQLSPGVRLGLAHAYERWDGKGILHLAGDAIALPQRIVLVGHDADIFFQLGGMELALESVRQRRGGGLDPSVADLFLREGAALMQEVGAVSVWDAVLEAEPEPRVMLSDSALDGATAALADFADLKSPYFHGHSSETSRLAESAARALGWPQADRIDLRRAALLHDIGRTGVPNGIWEKRGSLTPAELERVRLHSYYTERILARSPALAPLGLLAGSHHERVDGSGYHKGAAAGQLSTASHVLAAADVYQALTQERPHRPARTGDAAARELATQVDAGRLDRQAVNAVLEAAGQPRIAGRTEWPAGLSDREVEVLRMVCRGKTNREMAAALFLSEKTVGHHVEHIYDKIGRSTRAGAALFAMEHQLLSES